MASKNIIGVLFFVVACLFMTTVIAREIEKSSNLHAGGVRCHRYCGQRCCTEKEVCNLEHSSKVKPDVMKEDAATPAQINKAAEPNHHEGSGGGEKSSYLHAGGVRSCRRYCGRRCCSEDRIDSLEQNPTEIADAKKLEASTVQDNEAAPKHHHGGGSHHCYKYCGPHHRCCTGKEIRDLESSQKGDDKSP